MYCEFVLIAESRASYKNSRASDRSGGKLSNWFYIAIGVLQSCFMDILLSKSFSDCDGVTLENRVVAALVHSFS